MKLPETIEIKHSETGEPILVSAQDYVVAKCADLREFGYSDLTEEVVGEQLQKILSGEPLSVIGQLMIGDICLK